MLDDSEHVQSRSSQVTEKSWIEKKNVLKERLSIDRGALKIDRASLGTEGKRFLAEVERLQGERHSLARDLQDLHQQLHEKREIARKTSERLDGLEKNIERLASEEKSLQNENGFLESERSKLTQTYNDVSKRLSINMSALQATMHHIAFMKGEMATLIEKKATFRDKLAVKLRDSGNLDEKIAGTSKELSDLYNRMKAVEKNVKLSYYGKREHVA